MSGYICGKIVFDNQELGSFDDAFNKEVINQYKLDRFEYSSIENAQFACGLIHITEEDKSEKLPYYDIESGLYITADVILDNRDDLIKDLALSGTDKVITDGFIVLEAYKKWGYNTPKHLLGDFAFAIWDSKKEELFITRDHTGTRSLYYTKNENSIRFSTTLNPLIRRELNKWELWSEEWLTMYLALPKGVVDYDSYLTLYNYIFQSSIASSLVITKSGIRTVSFWDPLRLITKKHIKFSKKEWLDSFNAIFNKAVKCRTRSEAEIGVFLSSGLDSTAVAANASIQLGVNKILHSFTSIPQYEVEEFNKKHFVTSEKEGVEYFARHFSNIKPNFLNCEGLDIVSSADKIIKIIEMPFQAIENLTWINETYKKANGLGCKILLKGQFGNVTISRGSFFTHIQTLKKHKHYIEIWNEVKAIAKLYQVPKRYFLKKIIVANVPKSIKKFRKKLLGIKNPLYNPYLGYINDDLLHKYGIVEKLKRKKLYKYSLQEQDFYEEGNAILNEMVLTQVGSYDTKFGLHYGLVTRDPTKDVRIIEFCLKAPYQLFVEQGVERKLVRDAMEEIVPTEIRSNYDKRGVQGVDWAERINKNRTEFLEEIELLKNNQAVLHYLKKNNVNEIIDFGLEIFKPQNIEYLRQVVYWIILNKVLTE